MRRTAPLILVVDEDSAATADLTYWLYGRGFNAVCAASCLEARAVLDAMPIEGIIGHLALHDGSLFELAHHLRTQRGAVIIGYADVDVRPPPELDACFVRPLDLDVLSSFLTTRFAPKRSGEHALPLRDRRHSVPAARLASAGDGRRRR
jgi:hypothetical protein